MTTYETNNGYTSSNSSFVEESKKNDLIAVEDNKEEKKTKRSKRNSFKRMFNSKKDDKDDKDKDKPQSEGLVRSLSAMGIFGKDNKRSDSEKSEKFLRPTSRTSSNSDKTKNRRSFIFFSDNEDDNNKLDLDVNIKKGRKSRQNSTSDVEKEKTSKKENRLSLNIGKMLGLDGNKSSHKPTIWDDTFLEPGETVGTPKSPTRNYFQGGSTNSFKNKQLSNIMDGSYVESPVSSPRDILSTVVGTDNVNIPNPISKLEDIPSKKKNTNSEVTSDESPSPNDDFRSTNSSSSTVPSSVNDQEDYKEVSSNNNISFNQRRTEFNGENVSYYHPPISEENEEIESEQNSPTTPKTPRLIVTRSEQHESEFIEIFNDSNNQKQVSFEDVQREVQKPQQEHHSLVDSTVGSKSDSDRLTRINEIKNSMNVKPLVISSINEIHNTTHVKHITPDVQERERDIDSTTVKIVERQNQDNATITSTVTAQVGDKDQVEKKSSNRKPFSLSTLNPFQDKSIKENNSHNSLDERVMKKLQELEEMNRSLTNTKSNLETRVAEQSSQISKLNSMEQIMQQQMNVSQLMSETMQRLESKVNQPKEELDSTYVGKIFEDTIKRLENKIDQQNEELNYLKSIVGQLAGGNPQLYLTQSREIAQLRISHEDQNLIVAQHDGEENQSRREAYTKHTLVNTLVVNPLYNTITVSASIATSVLYAVYVRPVVGLVKVVRNGTAGFH
ncbi:16607_t:CDS:2 [Funneliformis geosporum]|nr:16607_t:CDS:2 [Funneliformis geosporum]